MVVSSSCGRQDRCLAVRVGKRPELRLGGYGQSEMMGLPGSQLSDKYLIPMYFGASSPNTLVPSLYIANVDTMDTTVDVKIGGVNQYPAGYPLKSGESMVVNYVIDGGPVEIQSRNEALIVASLNQQRRRAGITAWTGVSQSMALPVANISNQYVLPRYDYTVPSTKLNRVLIAEFGWCIQENQCKDR